MISPIELLIILAVVTMTIDGTKSKLDFFTKLLLITFTVLIGIHVAQTELI
jgi:hypothetical protein